MESDPETYDFGTLLNESESERLRLIYEGRMFNDNERGYDFHSLVWEAKEGGNWRAKREITRSSFESECTNQRWVSKLHSFDSSAGHAILQVAEGDAPKGSDSISYHYSWRKWDLNENREVAFLCKCEDPFQTYDP